MSTEISVPLSKPGYSYFERQRTVFKQNYNSSDSANKGVSLDNELAEFDLEVEKIKRDLFKLTPIDFGGGDDFGKVGVGKSALIQSDMKDVSLAEFDKGFASMDKDFAKGTSTGSSSSSTKTTVSTTTQGVGKSALQSDMKDLSLAEFDKGFASMDTDFAKGTGTGSSSSSTKTTISSTTSSTKKSVSSSTRQESFSSVTSSSSGAPTSTRQESFSSVTSSSTSGAPTSSVIGLPASSAITAGGSSSALDKMMLKVEHPIVQDAQGNKRLQLRFDVNEFKPEEVSVKAMDRTLMVVAEHREETATKKVYKKYSRQYILPHKINAESLNAILSADGVLDISAPAHDALEAPISERLLPIMQL